MTQAPADYVTAETVQVAQYRSWEEMIDSVRVRAIAQGFAELENLLLWREISSEIPHGMKAAKEKEFAAAMLISAATLRRKTWQIDGYAPDDLTRWIENGVSFEHFEKAHDYAELAKKTPRQLLDECIELGDENGKVMSVDQMIQHALGEKVQRPETFQAINLLSRLANLPAALGWAVEKAERYTAWLKQGAEFFR